MRQLIITTIALGCMLLAIAITFPAPRPSYDSEAIARVIRTDACLNPEGPKQCETTP